MVLTKSESISDMMNLITSEKKKGKKYLKVKVFQMDNSNGKIKYYSNPYFSEKGEGTEELIKEGYRIKFERTDKQATPRYDATGKLKTVSIKNVHTTNIIVMWD